LSFGHKIASVKFRVTTRFLFVMFIALLKCNTTHANGGFFVEGVAGAGTVSNKYKSKDISVENEVLRISLNKSSANVSVEYAFKNESKKGVTVRLAFPTVLINDHWNGYRDVDNYCIYEYGNKLTYYEVTGNKVEFSEQYAANLYSDTVDADAIYNWKVTELKFKPGEKKKINISYSSPYFGGEFNISNVPETTTPKIFKYLLHTGSSWKGKIKKCDVEIDGGAFDIKNLYIYPSGYTLNGNKVIWKHRNFEPGIKDNIEILVSSPKEGYLNGGDWSTNSLVEYEYSEFFKLVPVTDYEIKSNQNNPKYPVSNMSDDKLETAWISSARTCPYIDVFFKRPVNLYKIGILPGYFKTEELYKANNRVRKIEIEYSNKFKENIEYTDVGFNSFFSLLNNYYWKKTLLGNDFNNPSPNTTTINGLRIYFKECFQGDRYDNTCISGIRFIERVKEVPQGLHRGG